MADTTNIKISKSKEEKIKDKTITTESKSDEVVSKLLKEHNKLLEGQTKLLEKILKETQKTRESLAKKKSGNGGIISRLTNPLGNNTDSEEDNDNSKNNAKKPDSRDKRFTKSTLLSLLTGGLINPAIADAFMFQGPGKAIGEGANKAANFLTTKREKLIKENEKLSGKVSEDENSSQNTPTREGTTKKEVKPALNAAANQALLPNNDNYTDKSSMGAAEKSQTSPVLERLDRIATTLEAKNDNNPKNEAKSEGKGLFSKIFGVAKAAFGILAKTGLGILKIGFKLLTLLPVIGPILNMLKAGIQIIPSLIKNGLLKVGPSVIKALSPIGKAIKASFSKILTSIKNGIGKIGPTISNAIQGMIDWVKEKIGKIWPFNKGNKPDTPEKPKGGTKNPNTNTNTKEPSKKGTNSSKNTTTTTANKTAKVNKTAKLNNVTKTSTAAKTTAKATTKAATKAATKTGLKTATRTGLRAGAKVLGKVAAPLGMAIDAAFVGKDIYDAGGLGNYSKNIQEEAYGKSAGQNALGMINVLEPEKMLVNMEALMYKGLEKMFGKRTPGFAMNQDNTGVTKDQIDKVTNNVNQTLIGDNVGKALNMPVKIDQSPIYTENAYLAMEGNMNAANSMGMLSQFVNNYNTTTNQTPINNVVQQNISVNQTPSVYGSGPVTQALGR